MDRRIEPTKRIDGVHGRPKCDEHGRLVRAGRDSPSRRLAREFSRMIADARNSVDRKAHLRNKVSEAGVQRPTASRKRKRQSRSMKKRGK